MRFHWGAIPEAADFAPDAAWKPLREPSPWSMQLFALPIGLVACATVGILWHCLAPAAGSDFASHGIGLLVSVFAIIPVHELIHAAVHPGAGRSAHSILGFWPSRLLFYAHYDGELSRNRFLAILLMPFLVISLAPLPLCALLQVAPDLIVFNSTFNALLACGDLFGAGLIYFQLPPQATVRNQGWRTYWILRPAHPL